MQKIDASEITTGLWVGSAPPVGRTLAPSASITPSSTHPHEHGSPRNVTVQRPQDLRALSSAPRALAYVFSCDSPSSSTQRATYPLRSCVTMYQAPSDSISNTGRPLKERSPSSSSRRPHRVLTFAMSFADYHGVVLDAQPYHGVVLDAQPRLFRERADLREPRSVALRGLL